jgi:hypothetical protein
MWKPSTKHRFNCGQSEVLFVDHGNILHEHKLSPLFIPSRIVSGLNVMATIYNFKKNMVHVALHTLHTRLRLSRSHTECQELHYTKISVIPVFVILAVYVHT